MKLVTENYKGIAIRCIKNIIGGKPVVLANWQYKGKKYSMKGNTKEAAVSMAKKVIDRIL